MQSGFDDIVDYMGPATPTKQVAEPAKPKYLASPVPQLETPTKQASMQVSPVPETGPSKRAVIAPAPESPQLPPSPLRRSRKVAFSEASVPSKPPDSQEVSLGARGLRPFRFQTLLKERLARMKRARVQRPLLGSLAALPLEPRPRILVNAP